MKQLLKNILATLGVMAISMVPQISIAAEEGSAAGDAAAKTAVGGVSAGTIAAVIAIAAAAAAISDSGSGGGAITPTPDTDTDTDTSSDDVTDPVIEEYVRTIIVDIAGSPGSTTAGATATRTTGATATRTTGATSTSSQGGAAGGAHQERH